MSKRRSETRDFTRHFSSGGFRFLPTEVAQLDKLFEACASPKRQAIQSIADNFSNAPERKGHVPVHSKQIATWFQNKRYANKYANKLQETKEFHKSTNTATIADPFLAEKRDTIPIDAPLGKKSNDTQQLEFEAKSSRDYAWYDISTFLGHRMSSSGDPEILVRYVGFGEDEDEWLDLKSSVRQRSLPCEGFECVAVLSGDLILCYQEGSEHALYYDAQVVDVQRRRHDIRGCRCRFWVRYQHDLSEEVVPLRKVCRRPETDYRLKPLPQIPAALVPENEVQEDKPVTMCTISDSSAEQTNRSSHSDTDRSPNSIDCTLTEDFRETICTDPNAMIPTPCAAAISSVSLPASASDLGSTSSDFNPESPENLPVDSDFVATCDNHSVDNIQLKQGDGSSDVVIVSAAGAVAKYDCKQCTCWWE
ncbi:hypothetical protein O6H91_12G041800 [Diphasiastrum complanatum]|uniref:Uncharacterized protein n=1 Tax=Diphasiastrum complanatum TaxID=34168 RepID=A0ACC2C153_DIPCM|nr:hypothetical protein O6H91_12G041800 [Diphasiastrum complanatum]